MKKTSLLSLLSVLLCSISLMGCNGAEEKPNGEMTSVDDSPLTTELSNYTLSFIFIDNTENVSLPDGATGYIVGSWDGWDSFIPLAKNNNNYTMTFSLISVGSYEYKVVMWYENVDVSWDACVEITSTNQKLEVLATDGDNYQKDITIALNVGLPEVPTDEIIIDNILSTASKYKDAAEIGWDAYHYESYTPYEGSTSYYLSKDSDDYTYGSYVNDDGGDTTYSYFLDGVRYNYYSYEEEFENAYTSTEWDKNFDIVLSDLTLPFEPLYSYDEFDLSQYEVDVLVERETFTLTLTKYITYTDDNDPSYSCGTTYTYKYITDYSFNLVGVSYLSDDEEDGLETYYAELVTKEEVASTLDDFNIRQWNEIYWDSVTNPGALIEKIATLNNYTMELTIDGWESDSISYADYRDGEYNLDELYDSMTISYEYVLKINYTQDAVLFEDYYYDYFEQGIMLINDEENGVDIMYQFVSYQKDEWKYYGTYSGHWQNYYYSLADAYNNGGVTPERFILYSIGEMYGEVCAVYTTYDMIAYYIACCIGVDWWFGSSFSSEVSSLVYSGTYFFPYLQEVIFMYNESYWAYANSSHTKVCVMRDAFNAHVTDVGNTNINSAVRSALYSL